MTADHPSLDQHTDKYLSCGPQRCAGSVPLCNLGGKSIARAVPRSPFLDLVVDLLPLEVVDRIDIRVSIFLVTLVTGRCRCRHSGLKSKPGSQITTRWRRALGSAALL